MAYHPRSLRMLGMLQMIIGTSLFLLGILSIVFVPHWMSYVACGIWVGIWVGLTGMFSYLGAKSNNNPKNCLIGLTIGFAVTACLLAGVMVILHSIAVAEFGQRLRCPKDQEERSTPLYWSEYDKCDKYNMYHYPRLTYYDAQKGAAFGSLLLMLAIVEFFVAMASSIYGCNACVCCPVTPPQQAVMYIQQPDGSVILVSSGVPIPPGAAVQTIAAQPGQATVQGGQLQQGHAVSPQGYPVQSYQGYSAGAQTMAKPEEDRPPPYSDAVAQ